MPSEDITFCANRSCNRMTCERNPKHIKHLLQHSFAMFTDCPNFTIGGSRWLDKQLKWKDGE